MTEYPITLRELRAFIATKTSPLKQTIRDLRETHNIHTNIETAPSATTIPEDIASLHEILDKKLAPLNARLEVLGDTRVLRDMDEVLAIVDREVRPLEQEIAQLETVIKAMNRLKKKVRVQFGSKVR